MMNGIEYLGGGSGGGGGNVDDVYVNGESVLDESKIAQVTSYKEITQAEYEALPASKLTDGIAYFIKDSTEAEGFPPLIYSLQERQVGIWTDGRPLYQKVIHKENSQETFSDYVTIETISNAVPIKICGIARRYINSNTILWYAIPSRPEDGGSYSYNITARFYNDSIQYRIDQYGTQITDLWIIVQYIKTTDTPGSGTWTTQGALAHHYSTEEHIIGTWVDGKPLYEKTFLKTLSSTSTGGGYGSAIDSTDLPNGIIRSLSGYCGSMPFNGEFSRYDQNWEGYANIWGTGQNTAAYNFRWGDTASADAVIIVQYTKTTD